MRLLGLPVGPGKVLALGALILAALGLGVAYALGGPSALIGGVALLQLATVLIILQGRRSLERRWRARSRVIERRVDRAASTSVDRRMEELTAKVNSIAHSMAEERQIVAATAGSK